MASSISQECDIIMKGGVTSGVVYPAAVVALSATYRFRNIGGTSAGAIASAVTAAAEFARQTGSGAGFSGPQARSNGVPTDLCLRKAKKSTVRDLCLQCCRREV